MRIRLQREGGLAYFPGLSRPVEVDTHQLPPEVGERLEEIVHSCGLLENPVRQAPPRGGDYQKYTLLIESGDQQSVTELYDPVTDEDLQALLELLRNV
ncbi:MAG TPA: protealysin inhibitor emfourin [Meiothermus sp.]|nr:protealysin inhibitor emfourin [Meiothermus sp.]